IEDKALEKIVIESGIFDFRPSVLIMELGLLTPKGWKYKDTAAYGHFGRDIFPWEKTDKIADLKKAAGI
ncbi:MAG: methionine adenosyltransferase domain-containing protein, partial [Spirochaetes bacterium]|nr:methionine adenosyltransferase domain-containing protein [Spirochaetota bacterium]